MKFQVRNLVLREGTEYGAVSLIVALVDDSRLTGITAKAGDGSKVYPAPHMHNCIVLAFKPALLPYTIEAVAGKENLTFVLTKEIVEEHIGRKLK